MLKAKSQLYSPPEQKDNPSCRHEDSGYHGRQSLSVRQGFSISSGDDLLFRVLIRSLRGGIPLATLQLILCPDLVSLTATSIC